VPKAGSALAVAFFYSPLAAALPGVLGAIVGGLIGYFGRDGWSAQCFGSNGGDGNWNSRPRARAANRNGPRGRAGVERFGHGFYLGSAAGKTREELEQTAQAFEGKTPFPSAKYFRDRAWLKYEDVLVENLDSESVYAIDRAYSGARQVFDFVGEPLPQGATRLQWDLRYDLWRAASDFAEVIGPTLQRLRDVEERKRLSETFAKVTSRLESQRQVVRG
jgi:hypothetical protein